MAPDWPFCGTKWNTKDEQLPRSWQVFVEPIMTHHARFFLGNTLITSLQDQIGLLEYQNSEHFAGIVGKSSAGWVTKGLS